MELLLKVNATESEIYNGKIELAELQEAVGGGLIEIINLRNAIMIVNEEGLIKEFPYNILASGYAGIPIVGQAVLLTHESMEKLK